MLINYFIRFSVFGKYVMVVLYSASIIIENIKVETIVFVKKGMAKI